MPTFNTDVQEFTNLGKYFRETQDAATTQLTEQDWDAAMEASIEMISIAGFDQDDSDQLGEAMGSDVQTLLTLAFVRCPELMDLFGSLESTEYVPADVMVGEDDDA